MRPVQLLLCIPFIAYFLAHVCDVPGSELLFGLSYIPSVVVTTFGLVFAVYFWATNQPRNLRLAAFLSIANFVVTGDYSLRSAVRSALKSGDAALAMVGNQANHLRVMEMNVQYLRGGAENIAQFIRSHRPDVVMMSEFEFTDAELPKLRQAFYPYRLITSSARDTAIATRLDVIDVNEMPLPTKQPSLSGKNRISEQSERPQRSFLDVRVRFDGVALHVLPIRFIAGRPESYGLWDQLKWGVYLLEAQRKEVGAIRDYIAHLKEPYVFGGDLNATHASKIVQELSMLGDDVYLATNALSTSTFKTTPIPFTKFVIPMMRLDYIYSGPGMVPQNAEVIPWELSDHDPLLSSIMIDPNQQVAFSRFGFARF